MSATDSRIAQKCWPSGGVGKGIMCSGSISANFIYKLKTIFFKVLKKITQSFSIILLWSIIWDNRIISILNFLKLVITLQLCKRMSLSLGDVYLSIWEQKFRKSATNSQEVQENNNNNNKICVNMYTHIYIYIRRETDWDKNRKRERERWNQHGKY